VGNATIAGTLSVGTASTTAGTLTLTNSSKANTLVLQPGATSASYTLPTAQGAAGTTLQKNGTGP